MWVGTLRPEYLLLGNHNGRRWQEFSFPAWRGQLRNRGVEINWVENQGSKVFTAAMGCCRSPGGFGLLSIHTKPFWVTRYVSFLASCLLVLNFCPCGKYRKSGDTGTMIGPLDMALLGLLLMLRGHWSCPPSRGAAAWRGLTTVWTDRILAQW